MCIQSHLGLLLGGWYVITCLAVAVLLFLLMVMRATDNVTQLQVSDKFSSSLQEDATAATTAAATSSSPTDTAAATAATLRVDDWCNGLPADRLGLWHLGVELQEIVHGLPALDGGLLLWDLLQVSTGSYDERVLYMWNKT